MYNWLVDEEKFKKENSEDYAIWARNKKDVQKAVNFLSKNKWIIGGKIYVRKQKTGFINESPVVISLAFKKGIPKYKYVAFSFALDEEIASTVSVIDQKETIEDFPHLHLIGKF